MESSSPVKTVIKAPRPWQFSTRTLRILDGSWALICLLEAAFLSLKPELGFWFWCWFLYGIFGVFMTATNGTALFQAVFLKFMRIALISRLLS